ncbi:unnamed protein product [Ambrosiozyma monospora]|uniref:Unnamed protein product n=1 Tax=Ambrosiozyma monospora TaxID=43982 RepID=A0A9W7DDQ1_AMBMO|nr:unnamed protein product [Ambrosiozyma monospora]
MTPIEDESKQLGHASTNNSTAFEEGDDDDDDDESEVGLSFDSNQSIQKKVQEKHAIKKSTASATKPRSTSSSVSLRKTVASAGHAARPEQPGDKLWIAMTELSGMGKVIFPSNENDPDRKLLNTKYKIFLDQIETQQKYRKMVGATEDAIKAYLSI